MLDEEEVGGYEYAVMRRVIVPRERMRQEHWTSCVRRDARLSGAARKNEDPSICCLTNQNQTITTTVMELIMYKSVDELKSEVVRRRRLRL